MYKNFFLIKKKVTYVQKFQKIMYLQIFKGDCIYKNIFIFLLKNVYMFLVIIIC